MAKRILAALNDTGFFLQEWLVNPLRTGAIAPSSKYLAAAMAAGLPADRESHVLELGPGTGAITQGLIARGLPQNRLVAIEHNPRMAGLLRQRYPAAAIIAGDAWQLDRLLAELPTPVTTVGAVISSLPLLNFPPEQAEALARKIRALLPPTGKWVQFSYNLGNKHCRGASQFQLVSSKIVWLNVPPARVTVYQK
ncbi:MAG TPA: methyltransferase domain-containing protein [Dongiaceae bacterium]|nr:methyltransferase domain-containing protein [Dongiaceae bacterium]